MLFSEYQKCGPAVKIKIHISRVVQEISYFNIYLTDFVINILWFQVIQEPTKLHKLFVDNCSYVELWDVTNGHFPQVKLQHDYYAYARRFADLVQNVTEVLHFAGVYRVAQKSLRYLEWL